MGEKDRNLKNKIDNSVVMGEDVVIGENVVIMAGCIIGNHVTILDGAYLDFHVIVAYGVSILAVADNLIDSVKYKVEEFTGIEIEKINIYVDGVRVID